MPPHSLPVCSTGIKGLPHRLEEIPQCFSTALFWWTGGRLLLWSFLGVSKLFAMGTSEISLLRRRTYHNKRVLQKELDAREHSSWIYCYIGRLATSSVPTPFTAFYLPTCKACIGPYSNLHQHWPYNNKRVLQKERDGAPNPQF